MPEILKNFRIPGPKEIVAGFIDWIMTKGQWYALSFAVHALLLLSLTLAGKYALPTSQGEAPLFEADIDDSVPETELTHFEVGDAPLDPTVLDTESLTLADAPAVEEVMIDASEDFSMAGGAASEEADMALGGLGSFDIAAIGTGPAVTGPGGVGSGVGTGGGVGSGGSHTGFGRDQGSRKARVGSGGGTRDTERAVAAALNWLARHQNADGSWSMNYQHRCKDPTCGVGGTAKSDAAGTAFGLLPFLAAGQTHKSRGPYRKAIFGGVGWLVRNQKATGDLSAGSDQTMYSHGLAAIALCEAYGLSEDPKLSGPAQAALRFIESGQDPQTGGWWYKHKQRGGDTSVFGWQLMALKSGYMAELKVNPNSFAGGQAWLNSVAKGPAKGTFAYRPDSGASNTMTAVGLLCRQYLGMKKEDPAMQEGIKFLMANLPSPNSRNFYYWYYATQVMHNVPGAEWDTWNRAMRKTLIKQQAGEGCAEGSWDPRLPSAAGNSGEGGRLMMTSLGALTLEVYYRYLPLYKLDRPGGAKVAAN